VDHQQFLVLVKDQRDDLQHPAGGVRADPDQPGVQFLGSRHQLGLGAEHDVQRVGLADPVPAGHPGEPDPSHSIIALQ